MPNNHSNRDVDEVAVLWQTNAPRLWQYFQRFGVPDEDADDLIAEIFAVVLDQWKRFDGTNASGWIFTLARYELLTFRARRARLQRHTATVFEDSIRAPTGPELVVEFQELQSRIDEFREQLDPANRMILDALGTETTDDLLRRDIETATGNRIGVDALRARRMRIRTALASHLRDRGL